MYKTKPEELFFYPYKNEHSYSGINITLLDSFGDYLTFTGTMILLT